MLLTKPLPMPVLKQKRMIQNTIKAGIRLVIIFALTYMPDIQAQNSTSSPFSMFGIGELETRDFGRTTGMGNVGIGFQSRNFLNRKNPAALSGIDTLTFILDVSGAMKFSEFRTVSQKAKTSNFNFKNLAAGVRISKIWTSSMGLSPYSNVGYEEIVEQPVIGSYPQVLNVTYSGSGGVNKFYWANAFEVVRGLSFGVTSSFIFGNIVHNEEMVNVMSIKNTANLSKIYFDFGMQYSHWFGQFTRVVVGGTYGYKTDISVSHKESVSSGSYLLKNQALPDTKSYIPQSYGAGFSILRNKRDAEWIFAADYQYQNWSVDKSRYKTLKYTDSRVYSVGLQMTPNTKRPESYLQAVRFQLGACYNQSYLMVDGYQQDDYSVSVGVGLPFRNRSFVNVAANFGESRTGHKGGISERYALISVNLSLIEIWFAKRQWE